MVSAQQTVEELLTLFKKEQVAVQPKYHPSSDHVFSITEIKRSTNFFGSDRPLNRDLSKANELAAAQNNASLAEQGSKLLETCPFYSSLYRRLSEALGLRHYHACLAIALYHERLQQTI